MVEEKLQARINALVKERVSGKDWATVSAELMHLLEGLSEDEIQRRIQTAVNATVYGDAAEKTSYAETESYRIALKYGFGDFAMRLVHQGKSRLEVNLAILDEMAARREKGPLDDIEILVGEDGILSMKFQMASGKKGGG